MPAATMLHATTVRAIANAASTGIPADVSRVLGPGELALLALSGLVIAVAGALAPASWAAGTRTAFAIRAE